MKATLAAIRLVVMIILLGNANVHADALELNAIQIVFGQSGSTFLLQENGELYRRDAIGSSKRWASEILQIAPSTTGELFGLRDNGEVYRWDSAGKALILGSNLTAIAPASAGGLYVLRDTGDVYRWDEKGKSIRMGSNIDQIAPGPKPGGLFVRLHDDRIFEWDESGNAKLWGSGIKQISPAPAGGLYSLRDNGDVLHWDCQGNAKRLGSSIIAIGEGPLGGLYVIRELGEVIKWDVSGKASPLGSGAKVIKAVRSLSHFAPVTCSIVIQELRCILPTDQSHEDEVYIMVAGKTSTGIEISHRVPDEHWDMIAGTEIVTIHGNIVVFEGKTVPGNPILWSGELFKGQSVELTLFVMDEDRQEDPKGNPSSMASAAAQRTNSADSSIIGTDSDVEDLLDKHIINHGLGLIKDTDDCIGIIAVRLMNVGGKISVTWAERGRVHDRGQVKTARDFSLIGDGSEYKLRLQASQSTD